MFDHSVLEGDIPPVCNRIRDRSRTNPMCGVAVERTSLQFV